MRDQKSGGGMLSCVILEIEWDTKVAKLLLLFFQIFISELVESAVPFEYGQECVDLRLEGLVVTAGADGPLFLLKWC